MVVQIIIAVLTLVCAVAAIVARRLLTSALWLAGASALTALLLYLLGAPEVAVIELSVGAGLVTVLFVFAINIAGEENFPAGTRVPRWLAWGLIAVTVLLASYFALPRALIVPSAAGGLSGILWDLRQADMLLQVALIFSGVLGLLGLLSEREGLPSERIITHGEVKP